MGNEWNIPSDDVKNEMILGSVELGAETLAKINDLKQELSENYKEIKDETGIPRRVWNTLVKTKFKNDSLETIQKNQEISFAIEKYILDIDN